MNRSENNDDETQEFEYDNTLEEAINDTGLRTSNRHTVEYTSDEANAIPKSASQVLESMSVVMKDASEDVKYCMRDANSIIIGLQRDVERLRRENSDLQKVVDGVYRISKPNARR